jgi:probable aminopeptidase NPEPL1
VTTPASDAEWAASSPLEFSSSLKDAASCDALAVVGKKACVLDEGLLAHLPDAVQTHVRLLAFDIKPGSEGAKRTTSVVLFDEEGDEGTTERGTTTLELTVIVLPDASKLSRHNAPSASHALTKCLAGVKAPRFGKTLGLVCALADASEAVAIAAAVARAFPTYSAKSTEARNTESGRGAVAVKGTVKVALHDASRESHDEKTKNGNKSSVDSFDGDAELKAAKAVAGGVRLAARIVDTPPAFMDPDALVAEALSVCAELNKSVLFASDENGKEKASLVVATTLREKELIAGGFGGIVGVGAAAARDGREPALVHLCHKGDGALTKGRSTALVGKGITFDTGGLQIKGKAGMPGMKTDLGGAAAALGAFQAAVLIDPDGSKRGGGDLHCVLCVAENAVGPSSFRPDDVLLCKSGRSVEINNTDAEGRLVLADGVAFASGEDVDADDVVDIATLTGAQMVATGRFFAGIVSDSEEFERECVVAGRKSGDLTHPLPYAPEFFSREFGSAVADMRNSVKDRANAQASCAGQFIADHLAPGFAEPSGGGDARQRRWLHVDIAGPATEKGTGRGTGFGVALLVELLHANASREES